MATRRSTRFAGYRDLSPVAGYLEATGAEVARVPIGKGILLHTVNTSNGKRVVR